MTIHDGGRPTVSWWSLLTPMVWRAQLVHLCDEGLCVTGVPERLLIRSTGSATVTFTDGTTVTLPPIKETSR